MVVAFGKVSAFNPSTQMVKLKDLCRLSKMPLTRLTLIPIQSFMKLLAKYRSLPHSATKSDAIRNAEQPMSENNS